MARAHFYGRIFYLRAPGNERAPKIFSAWYFLINSIYPKYFQNYYIFSIDCCRCFWILSFFMKNPKKIEIFQIFPDCKISGKNWIFKKKFKLQIALKNSLFELWHNKEFVTRFYHKDYISKKIFWRARTSARGARWISHRCENSKIMVFWHRW